MQLEQQLKQLIIDSLALEDISIEDIETDTPLFSSEGLGLDSVDALELGLAVQKTFGLQLDGEQTQLRDYFESVATLAHFIRTQKVRHNFMTEQEIRDLLTEALESLFEIDQKELSRKQIFMKI